MHTLLAADIFNFLVPLVFLIIWGISQAMQATGQKQQQGRGEGQGRAREETGRKRQMQDFLRELGVDQATAEEAQRRGTRRAAAPQGDEDAEEAARVRERHLRSELERRHHEELQSSLARQEELSRLAAQMEARGGAPPGAPPTAAQAPPPARRAPVDPIMLALLTSRDQFARAYMLGQVLGPPPGAQD